MARLLLIDDDDLLREMLAAALVEAGHSVLQARDGRTGTEIFRVEPADLVVTDLVMPNREGLELIVALHREHPGLPIIAMSGAANYSKLYLELAGKLGARRVLAKPFTVAALINAIDDILAENPPPDAPP